MSSKPIVSVTTPNGAFTDPKTGMLSQGGRYFIQNIAQLLNDVFSLNGTLGFKTVIGVASVNQIGSGDPEAGKYVDGGTGAWTELPTVPQSLVKEESQWLDSYDAGTGEFTQSQPAFSDISGSIDGEQIPPPTTTKLGGVFASGTTAHQWVDQIDGAGNAKLSQPQFSDIGGNITTGQLPTTGLTVTIATAKLTTGGANGSMTFTNGLLTGQVPAS